MFGSFCFTSSWTGPANERGYIMGYVSLQTLSVFGSSLVRQNLDSHVFFCFWLQFSAASNVFGSDGSCWAGLVWFAQFGCVRFLTEPVGSESEVVAGRQAVLVRLAVRLVDVYSVGRARVCFKTLATAVFSDSRIDSTTLCLMYLRFFANAFNYHVMEVVVTYRLSLHLTGEKMASKLAWTNSSVVLGG